LKRQWKLSKTRRCGNDAAAGPGYGYSGNTDQIILYSTSWCGYCKAAEKFLKEKGLAYVKKDIEADDNASLEMQAKCMRNGAQQCGVP
jgi:glutaredoxin